MKYILFLPVFLLAACAPATAFPPTITIAPDVRAVAQITADQREIESRKLVLTETPAALSHAATAQKLANNDATSTAIAIANSTATARAEYIVATSTANAYATIRANEIEQEKERENWQYYNDTMPEVIFVSIAIALIGSAVGIASAVLWGMSNLMNAITQFFLAKAEREKHDAHSYEIRNNYLIQQTPAGIFCQQIGARAESPRLVAIKSGGQTISSFASGDTTLDIFIELCANSRQDGYIPTSRDMLARGVSPNTWTKHCKFLAEMGAIFKDSDNGRWKLAMSWDEIRQIIDENPPTNAGAL